MKKISFALMLLCFCAFVFSCAYHPIEMPNEIKAPKKSAPEQEPEPYSFHNDDNIYNNEHNIVSSTCGDNYVNPNYGLIDFYSYNDFGGRLFFWTYNYPYMVEIYPDETGYFNIYVDPAPELIFNAYYAFGANIEGTLKDGALYLYVVEDAYMGPGEHQTEYVCTVEYEMNAYARYEHQKTEAKYLEGQYKTKYLHDKTESNCTFKRTLDPFPLYVVRNYDGTYDMSIDFTKAYAVKIPANGELNFTVDMVSRKYYVKGTITPDFVTLTMKIETPGYYHGCTEEYVMNGHKRFEESDETDTVTDGIYVTKIERYENDCDDGPNTGLRLHMESVQMNENQSWIIMGNKQFHIDIRSDGSFSAINPPDSAAYKITQTFEGNIKPNWVEGKVVIKKELPGIKTCHYRYNVFGKKLYKHL
ncbi:hypothetical protein ACFL29_02430 [Patescibacteria group bacterium]